MQRRFTGGGEVRENVTPRLAERAGEPRVLAVEPLCASMSIPSLSSKDSFWTSGFFHCSAHAAPSVSRRKVTPSGRRSDAARPMDVELDEQLGNPLVQRLEREEGLVSEPGDDPPRRDLHRDLDLRLSRGRCGLAGRIAVP
jgi:hypothetical protein